MSRPGRSSAVPRRSDATSLTTSARSPSSPPRHTCRRCTWGWTAPACRSARPRSKDAAASSPTARPRPARSSWPPCLPGCVRPALRAPAAPRLRGRTAVLPAADRRGRGGRGRELLHRTAGLDLPRRPVVVDERGGGVHAAEERTDPGDAGRGGRRRDSLAVGGSTTHRVELGHPDRPDPTLVGCRWTRATQCSPAVRMRKWLERAPQGAMMAINRFPMRRSES